jgi:hypothetical protein
MIAYLVENNQVFKTINIQYKKPTIYLDVPKKLSVDEVINPTVIDRTRKEFNFLCEENGYLIYAKDTDILPMLNYFHRPKPNSDYMKSDVCITSVVCDVLKNYRKSLKDILFKDDEYKEGAIDIMSEQIAKIIKNEICV